ncbi:hypothetical protein KKB69_00300 [Patescibacteria group bacterium]|nr:hypothetical protein [Patescibacteria group bacterium]
MKRGILAITTGISLCGRKEIFLPAFEKYCKEKDGKKIKILNIGSELLSWLWEHTREEIPRDNILNADPLTLKILEATVFQNIKYQLEGWLKENDVVILNFHMSFEWRNISLPTLAVLFMKELISFGLEPDYFFCFIDNAKNILERLKSSRQWKNQVFSEGDLWKWQNHEVDNTKILTYLFDTKKKFFVMPVMQPPETMYYLFFEPWRPVIYAQMPISHVTVKELKKVKVFISQMRKFAVVFDPLTIETGVVEVDKDNDDAEVRVRSNQTAHRDVNWFIPQAHGSAAYWVKIVHSSGVADETVISSQRGKETWIIFPADFSSPFMVYRATENLFKGPEDFLKFFASWSEEREKDWKERHGAADGGNDEK